MSATATVTALARPDHRAYDELRPLRVVYEGLGRVDGSARFLFGSTAALASISGPIEVRPLSELPSTATLDVFVRPLAGLPGPSSKFLASSLRSLLLPSLQLARYPRSLVQLVVQAASPAPTGTARAGGGSGPAGGAFHPALIAAYVNAASGALLSAGSIGMAAVVCAAAVGRLGDPGAQGGISLVLDPSEDEEGLSEGGGYFSFMFGAAPDNAQVNKEETPSCRLVWTNYTAAISPETRKLSPVSSEELARATWLAATGAREVWTTFKVSLADMDRPRGSFVPKATPTVAPPALAKSTVAGAGEGEMEDEMEEIDDDEMEI